MYDELITKTGPGIIHTSENLYCLAPINWTKDLLFYKNYTINSGSGSDSQKFLEDLELDLKKYNRDDRSISKLTLSAEELIQNNKEHLYNFQDGYLIDINLLLTRQIDFLSISARGLNGESLEKDVSDRFTKDSLENIRNNSLKTSYHTGNKRGRGSKIIRDNMHLYAYPIFEEHFYSDQKSDKDPPLDFIDVVIGLIRPDYLFDKEMKN